MVVLTATACSAGGEETLLPAEQTTTYDVPGSPAGNVKPAATRSPEASVLFDWVPFADEPSRTSAALPEGAEPVSNTITGPDGAAITTRGYVFEHAAGVIGFEVIDGFATPDDVEKLAELLADSVGGAVLAAEEVDAGRARGVDGEIAYGNDQLMLFRILVLNGEGDVWNGFVGGPETDRERLDSEFARLTVSASLRGSADWMGVRDEPTGIVVQLPSGVEPEDLSVDGMPQRGYHHSSGVGFVVVDYPPDDYPLDAVLADIATASGADVDGTRPAEAQGYEALDGVLVDQDEWVWAYRAVALEEQLLLLYAVDRAVALAESQAAVERMTESLVVP
ncbi:hypothetical protein [Jiangella rhizosphaerae]|uniref:Uncharacterized protein n=1 Tax=Jiangella rhizosphaerae TaxID=2293569 RepID=A0A418KWB1_9ACTN|nr:hypothetical protein [Jiangella rhizosphaerae]RIQ35647.1 hypothetical protein DY240_02460 [Jiangella rhizosphaerae]